jgi:hypothetical protein
MLAPKLGVVIGARPIAPPVVTRHQPTNEEKAMNSATTSTGFSTSRQIKSLGLPAPDARKALRILALSEVLIGLFFAKSATKA